MLAGAAVIVALVAGCGTAATSGPAGSSAATVARSSAATVAGPAGTGGHDIADTYGPLPTFLPSAGPRPDSVLVGTAARPALTTEGDPVRVMIGTTSVLMTVTGPQVPGEGLPVQTDATTCTWTVTMTGASAPVPVRPADFTTLDHLGAVDHPRFVAGQPVPAAVLRPGASVTFELRDIMQTGEGLLRFAPGSATLASWDFEVETD